MTLDSIKGSDSNAVIGQECSPEMNPTPPKTLAPDAYADSDFICPVCSSPSISSCRNCKKISYCGKAHQRHHWKLHKENCFPLIHQYDPILGSRLIATRNIKPGEIIWKEKSILSGPGIVNEEKEKAGSSINPPRLCLGCCKVINTDYTCPSCSWPMCGPNCEGDHGKLECKIFTREQLVVLPQLGEGESQLQWQWYKYGAITILRGVLLKDLDPSRWKNILELDEMWNGKEGDNSQDPSEQNTTTPTISNTKFGQFCHEFIMSLNAFNVTNEDIALVLRVISHRRCQVYDDELYNLHRYYAKQPSTFQLFPIACQATQNCVPNSSWIIQDTGEIHIRALVPIQFGRTVTLSYASVEDGIMGRQAWLEHGKSCSSTAISCECERCKDPTELGTFYSAIKCPEVHGNSSESLKATATITPHWLLPTSTAVAQVKVHEEDGNNPNTELMWKCHECGLNQKPDYYMKVVSEINKEFCDTCEQVNQNNGSSWKPTLIDNLESLRQKYTTHFVHPNHFAIFKVDMMLLDQLSSQLANLHGKLDDEMWALRVERFTSLCKKWLEVGDVLWPGLSRQRGQLLYYYQQALVIEMIISISRRMRGSPRPEEDSTANAVECEQSKLQNLANIKQSLLEKEFMKILSIRKVVVEIFCYDDVHSFGRKYADSLVKSCPEIELLNLYVFQTNKKCI